MGGPNAMQPMHQQQLRTQQQMMASQPHHQQTMPSHLMLQQNQAISMQGQVCIFHVKK